MSDGLTLEKMEVVKRLSKLEINVAETNLHLRSIAEILVEAKTDKKTQDDKIRKLEDWKNYVLGGIGAIGGVFAFIVTMIDKLHR